MFRQRWARNGWIGVYAMGFARRGNDRRGRIGLAGSALARRVRQWHGLAGLDRMGMPCTGSEGPDSLGKFGIGWTGLQRPDSRGRERRARKGCERTAKHWRAVARIGTAGLESNGEHCQVKDSQEWNVVQGTVADAKAKAWQEGMVP